MNKIKRSNWWQINNGSYCSLTIKRVSWVKLYYIAEILLGIIFPEILTFKKNIFDKITFWGYTILIYHSAISQSASVHPLPPMMS